MNGQDSMLSKTAFHAKELRRLRVITPENFMFMTAFKQIWIVEYLEISKSFPVFTLSLVEFTMNFFQQNHTAIIK